MPGGITLGLTIAEAAKRKTISFYRLRLAVRGDSNSLRGANYHIDIIDIFSCLTSTGLRKLQQKEEQTDHLKLLILAIPA